MFYKTQDNMPNRNRLILGTSSFWIINLIYYSFIHELYFQSLLLSSITIISPLFWYYYRINSIYHKLDNYLSILILINLLLCNSFNYYFEFIFMIKFYYLSIIFTLRKNYNIQLFCHLMFRLLFYKMLMMSINNTYKINYDIIKYLSNNLLLFMINNDKNKFKYNYLLYSIETMIVTII